MRKLLFGGRGIMLRRGWLLLSNYGGSGGTAASLGKATRKRQYASLSTTSVCISFLSFVAVAQTSSIVAIVGGEPITAVELQQFVQPIALRIGVDPPPDPRRQALEEAIRVRLLAREGKRRGLKVPDGRAAFVRAQLHQALIKAVLDERGISVDAVNDVTAKAYFEAHSAEILKVASVQVRALMVDDAALAERVLHEAAGISAEAFGNLVEKHSLDADSKKNGGLIGPIDHCAGVACLLSGSREDALWSLVRQEENY